MKQVKASIKSYFTKYFDYRSGTGKTEYFLLVCFGLTLLTFAETVAKLLGAPQPVMFAVDIALLLPLITLSARRLNDGGKNWIFAFALMLPSPFNLILIGYLLVLKGRDNRTFGNTYSYATYGMLAAYGVLRVLGYLLYL